MRFVIALLAAGLAACAAVPAAQAQSAPADDGELARVQKVNEALGALRAEKPAEALAILEPVLAEYEALYPASKGPVRCTDDEADLGKRRGPALLISNGWCFALWGKAFVLVDLGRLPEAVAPAARAAALMPDRAQFHSELGYIHQTLRRYDLSLAAYADAARVAAAIADEKSRKFELRRAWFGMAYDYIELEKFDDAEAYLKKALEVAPGEQKILNELEYVRQQRAKAKARS